MLLTIPIDFFVNVAAGLALSLAGHGQGPAPWRVAVVFHVFVLTPVCAYFLLAFPDWSWAYLVEPSPARAALVIAAYLAGGLGAFGLGRHWMAGGRWRAVLGATAAALLLSGLALALTFPRFIAVGDAAAFAQGRALPLWEQEALLTALPCLGAAATGGFLLALLTLIPGRAR